jgi:hypothetical protein
MKQFTAFLIALAVALPLAAQEEAPRAQGYGYFGLAETKGTTFGKLLNVGGGGEGFVYKGLAVGADLGYLGYYKNYRSDGFGLLSTNGSYHFAKQSKVVPFVTAGYSLAFRQGTGNMTNVGGGITYWFSRKVGFRTEVRDYFTANDPHMIVARVGLSFR